ncbi:MAG: T9SS type A sorting domain-containing protein, partial [Flavobacteriales bacterium]|nr:T9SS type A sorting domain-containing protein [Flavobacteriales bacterium]
TVIEDEPIQLSKKNQNTNYFSIYPNPTDGKLHIVYNTLLPEGSLVVYNRFGQAVYRGTINNQDEIIDFSTYVSGVYLIKIVNKEGVFIRKVVYE